MYDYMSFALVEEMLVDRQEYLEHLGSRDYVYP